MHLTSYRWDSEKFATLKLETIYLVRRMIPFHRSLEDFEAKVKTNCAMYYRVEKLELMAWDSKYQEYVQIIPSHRRGFEFPQKASP